MYDFLVVGAGLYGASFARLAADAGLKVLVLEKQDHVAGNIWTEQVEGIHVHRCGPHIFHTDDEQVWRFVNRFAAFNPYIHSPVADYHGERYPLPFSMHTFTRMWGPLSLEQAQERIRQQRLQAAEESNNLQEQAISLVGRDIYNKLIRGYTEKQWGRPCDQLPAFIIRRLPVRFTWDCNYFDDRYQGIPADGYTRMVERMLEGIEVCLNTDYLADKAAWNSQARHVIYTGQIDAYYDYCLGELHYRMVRYETELLKEQDHQGNAVVNYTDRETPWIRVIEHKWFDSEHAPKDYTIVSREYSHEWHRGDYPSYPINDEVNNELYHRYQALAQDELKVTFGGRLGEYRYYDMDTVIARAMAKFHEIQEGK